MNSPRKLKYIIAGLAALVTFSVYLPALQNGFVTFDDPLYIYENPNIRSVNSTFFKWAFLDFYGCNWHPVTWMSHAADYALWGLNPSGHHLTGVIFHVLNVFLVVLSTFYLLNTARLVLGTREGSTSFLSDRSISWVSAITGLLFGIHPLHVESVAWVSERKDVLCAFFFLLSILSYIKYIETTVLEKRPAGILAALFNGRYQASLAFFLLALMSKAMAVSLPPVLLVMDWYPFGRFKKGGSRLPVLEKIPFIVLSLAVSVITIMAQSTIGETTGITPVSAISYNERIFASFNAVVSYAIKICFPVNLSPFYPYPPDVSLLSAGFMVPFALVLAATAACMRPSKYQKVYSAVWLYYLLTLFPVLGIVQVGEQVSADRYTYLPSIGPFLLIGMGFTLMNIRLIHYAGWKPYAKWTSLSVAAVIIGIMSYKTIMQTRIWKNSTVFWSRIIEVEPGVPDAYYQLGNEMMKLNKTNEAMDMFEKAVSLKPSNVYALNALAICLIEKKQYDKALSYADTAVRAFPRKGIFNNTVGEIYLGKGEYEKSLEYFRKAASLDPDVPSRYFNIALALENLGKTSEACENWRRYLEVGNRPEDADEISGHIRELGCK